MTQNPATEPAVPEAPDEDAEGHSMHWSDADLKGEVEPVEWSSDDTEAEKS